jgi:hypothetical protein
MRGGSAHLSNSCICVKITSTCSCASVAESAGLGAPFIGPPRPGKGGSFSPPGVDGRGENTEGLGCGSLFSATKRLAFYVDHRQL